MSATPPTGEPSFTPPPAWPPVDVCGRWNELVAILRREPGATFLGASLARNTTFDRNAPWAVTRLRTRLAVELLGLIADDLIRTGSDARLGDLPGRDITGRDVAVQMLVRAVHVCRHAPEQLQVDEDLAGLLGRAIANPAAAAALVRLRDEVLAAGPPAKEPPQQATAGVQSPDESANPALTARALAKELGITAEVDIKNAATFLSDYRLNGNAHCALEVSGGKGRGARRKRSRYLYYAAAVREPLKKWWAGRQQRASGASGRNPEGKKRAG